MSGKHTQDSEVRPRSLRWLVFHGRSLIGTYTNEVEAHVHAHNAPGTHVVGCGV